MEGESIRGEKKCVLYVNIETLFVSSMDVRFLGLGRKFLVKLYSRNLSLQMSGIYLSYGLSRALSYLPISIDSTSLKSAGGTYVLRPPRKAHQSHCRHKKSIIISLFRFSYTLLL